MSSLLQGVQPTREFDSWGFVKIPVLVTKPPTPFLGGELKANVWGLTTTTHNQSRSIPLDQYWSLDKKAKIKKDKKFARGVVLKLLQNSTHYEHNTTVDCAQKWCQTYSIKGTTRPLQRASKLRRPTVARLQKAAETHLRVLPPQPPKGPRRSPETKIYFP